MYKQPPRGSVLRSSFGCLALFLCFLSVQGQNVPPPQAGVVQANGMCIAYESFGNPKAETILLIAGTNAQLTAWPVEFCQQLVQHGYRVIRFDNRDVGLSTWFDQAGLPDWNALTKALQDKTTPPLAYSLDDMARDAVELLKALHIAKVHVVGASMGGMIAQRVAYQYPQHTRSLVSLMAGGGSSAFPLVAKPEAFASVAQPGPASDTTAYVQRELQARQVLAGPTYPVDEGKIREQVRADVKRAYHPDGLHRQGAASTAGFYAGRQAQLSTIRVPTLVIHGSQDPLVAVEAGKDVAALVPNARFELVLGMGHSLPNALISQLVALIVTNARRSGK